jgi:hypothetical protein
MLAHHVALTVRLGGKHHHALWALERFLAYEDLIL